jgi:MinD-like ATPase involved in chromosome partitioning or flagellar assembly/uncharacterized membrane protein
MPNSLLTVSFVSGKGGVGKTSIAANFALIASGLGKTVLIDLDFQNQGATGLLTLFFKFEGVGAMEALLDPAALQQSTPVWMKPGLYFIPAISTDHPPPHREIASVVNRQDFAYRLADFMERLKRDFGFRVAVLDCHGGLDLVSLAAYEISTHTVVVTEADTVTFNGTLELLDFYDSTAGQTPHAAAAENSSNQTAAADPSLKFIVNRLPPKFKWEDLRRVYKRTTERYKDNVHLDPEVLSFIPEEDLVADNFGEYPFYAELAPKSIFANKVRLIVYKLLSPHIEIPDHYKDLSKFKNERYRMKLERLVISEGAKNTRLIITTFALLSCLVFYAIMLAIVGLVGFYLTGGHSDPFALFDNRFVASIQALLGFVLLFYVIRGAFGLMRYYREQYRFQRALVKALAKPPSLSQRIGLARLLLLRIGTTIGPVIVILYLLLLSPSLPFVFSRFLFP